MIHPFQNQLRQSVAATWWHLSSADRSFAKWAAAGLLTIFLFGAAGSTWLAFHLNAEEQTLSKMQAQVEAMRAEELQVASRAQAEPPAVTRWRALPVQPSLDPVIADALRWSAEMTLTVVRASVQDSVPAKLPGSISHAVVQFELQGPYPALKLWLNELVSRYPSLQVQRLDIQRQASGQGISAVVSFDLLGRAP